MLAALPHRRSATTEITPAGAGADWQPDVREEIRLTSSTDSHEMDPYIRRMQDGRLLVTVAEPVERDRHNVGIVLLTRDAREVDASLFAVRTSILGLFVLALLLTVLLSWYLVTDDGGADPAPGGSGACDARRTRSGGCGARLDPAPPR